MRRVARARGFASIAHDSIPFGQRERPAAHTHRLVDSCARPCAQRAGHQHACRYGTMRLVTNPTPDFSRPVLRSLFCGVSFSASPLFPDVRGSITQDLLAYLKTDEWQFESHELNVVSEEARRIVSVEPGTLVVVVGDPPADGESLRDEYMAIATIVFEHLRVTSLSDLAMHLTWHIGIEGKPGSATWLHEYLGLSSANTFFDAFGGKPTEAEAKFLFEPQEDVAVSATLKPIDAEEAADDSFFNDDAKNFFDEAVELALWRFRDAEEHEIEINGLIDAWLDGYSRLMKMSERACLAITGGG